MLDLLKLSGYETEEIIPEPCMRYRSAYITLHGVKEFINEAGVPRRL